MTGLAAPDDASPNRLGPLSHPCQAKVRPALRTDRQQVCLKTDAVIFDAQNQLLALEGQIQAYPIGASVLSDVGQRFTGNAEDLGLSCGRQRRARDAGAGVEGHGEFRGFREKRRVLLQGRRNSTIRRHGIGQAQDCLAHVHVD